ncbi:ATP-binding SpoIIE family protein phosphatase [Sphingomonas rubra]|uniref:Anti-sigma regulatory factor (Ser/Thr protein kinase) n=1 Tax=Sphingomonas rubra TaxID=634430 RepID=A0A1I5TCR0_9SPHN|nr:ATP-binding SpoIIE family protein phosphatase [Sphingomonas rubra]SFP80621.1 Anti-sigma regulatory factor (Ser/Thr protein kinase) [Sphingomonas rubra]
MRLIEVRDVSQVAEARRTAVALAEAHGFDESDAGRVAIVATELATNILKHGDGGNLLIDSFEDASGAGIECLALDTGAGMADVALSMRDGHSTTGTAGNGLGAVSRGSHVTDIYSAPGCGTAIMARLQKGRPGQNREREHSTYGAVSLPMRGEEACGDAWCRKDDGSGPTFMVADGLGHGPLAAQAAHAATRTFHASNDVPPSEMLIAMHGALRPTRGAAIGIAHFDPSGRQVVFAGVGNIAATLVDTDNGVRRMISNNGTIGHIARRMRDFTYPITTTTLVILASDGLATSWDLASYPGLTSHHPALIAGVLWRDFNRGRDDVTVFVGRIEVA